MMQQLQSMLIRLEELSKKAISSYREGTIHLAEVIKDDLRRSL